MWRPSNPSAALYDKCRDCTGRHELTVCFTGRECHKLRFQSIRCSLQQMPRLCAAILIHIMSLLATGIDADVAASRFIVALTSPPDARYSPLTRAPSGNSPPTVFEQVRALVFPITPETEIAKVRPAKFSGRLLCCCTLFPKKSQLLFQCVSWMWK